MNEQVAAREARDTFHEQVGAQDLISDDRLVKIYLRIRETKSAKQKEVDAAIKALDDQLATIATELKKRCQERGQEGFKTEFGTVYTAVKFQTSCQDWQIFYDWIKQNDALDYLERRISSGKVKSYMEENEGAIPPGVSVFKELEVRIRKPTGQ